MNTAERIELLAKQRKTNVTSVESALRLGHGVIRSWATSYPVASKILAVANYFDVSVDYLLCRTDRPNIAFSTAQAARAFLDQMQSVIDRANQTLAEFSEEEQPE